MKSIALKQWLTEAGLQLRITPRTAWQRLAVGSLSRPATLRRKNARVIFVHPHSPLSGPGLPRPGEIPLKQFAVEESQRTGLDHATILNRFGRGRYRFQSVRRHNARCIFVTLPAVYTPGPIGRPPLRPLWWKTMTASLRAIDKSYRSLFGSSAVRCPPFRVSAFRTPQSALRTSAVRCPPFRVSVPAPVPSP